MTLHKADSGVSDLRLVRGGRMPGEGSPPSPLQPSQGVRRAFSTAAKLAVVAPCLAVGLPLLFLGATCVVIAVSVDGAEEG